TSQNIGWTRTGMPKTRKCRSYGVCPGSSNNMVRPLADGLPIWLNTRLAPGLQGTTRGRAMRAIRWLVLMGVCVGGLHAQQPAKQRYEFRKDHDPDGIGKFYLGREIAHGMGHQAADWLERPEREQEERSSQLRKMLKVKDGDVVA